MKYKGKNISLKDFIVGTHQITVNSMGWTSASWIDILEDIYLKLSFISYPFKYIYYAFKILIEIKKNGKKLGDKNE